MSNNHPKKNLPNIWIRENSLPVVFEEAAAAMRRSGESPVRVLETNVDFPLSLNGDLNKGPTNGNKRSSLHDHHLHHHHHHPVLHHHHDLDAEGATPSDTMLKHNTKYPLANDDDDDDTLTKKTKKPGKLQKMASKHGLTKKGLVLLLLFGFVCLFLLVALLVLVIMWPRPDEMYPRDVCLTPDCLRASAQ
ncbi:hypothetical protein SK128_027381, partial [Halocaridina rubra]